MKFNTEQDAWDHWIGLYDVHMSHDAARIENMRMFVDWIIANHVTWKSEDIAEEKFFSKNNI